MISGFSVVVPTYKRADALLGCLHALASQRYPASRFEVIVVIDGGGMLSMPATPLPCAGCGTKVLFQANQGPAQARNFGASHARFSHLAFTDDDCEPEDEWLQRLEAACELHPRSMVGGLTRNRLRRNLYAETSQVVVSASYRWHNRDPEQARFLASNNMACPRSQFLAIGGFDPAFRTSEDRDFCDRWLRAGWTILQIDSAIIHHSHQLNAAAFWNQHRGYGHGAYLFHQAKAARGGKHYRPDLGFLGHLLVEAFATMSVMQSILTVLLALLSQVASLHGFIEAVIQHRQPRHAHHKVEV